MQSITKSFVCVPFCSTWERWRHETRFQKARSSHIPPPSSTGLMVFRSSTVRISNAITRTPQPLSYDAAPGSCICLSAGLAPFTARRFCFTVERRKRLLLGPRGICFCSRTRRELTFLCGLYSIRLDSALESGSHRTKYNGSGSLSTDALPCFFRTS